MSAVGILHIIMATALRLWINHHWPLNSVSLQYTQSYLYTDLVQTLYYILVLAQDGSNALTYVAEQNCDHYDLSCILGT